MNSRPRVLLLLSVLQLTSVCDRSGGPPRLELSEAEYAAPRVGAGSGVEASFRVRNTGQGPLHFRALVADCACQAAVVGSETLGPGEQAMIGARCRAVPGGGDVRRLRLHSNDPVRGISVLTLHVPEVGSVAQPAQISFGYVAVGQEAVREIVVPDASPPLRIGTGAAAVTLEPRASGGGSRTYRVRFAPRESGVVRTILTRGIGTAPIAVSGIGFAGLAVYPAEVRTPSTVAEDLPVLMLKNLTAVPVEIVRIDYPPDIAGDVQTVVAGEQFRLRLRSVRPHRDEGSPGAIRVHTTAAGAPSVIVPVIRTAALVADGA